MTTNSCRSIFSKFGGNLGELGSVSFSFDKKGHLIYNKSIGSFDKVFEFAIEADADNAEEFDEYIEVISSVESFSGLREKFIKRFGDPQESGLVSLPQHYVSCSEDTKNSLVKMIDLLEDNDDVQKVYHNSDL